MFTGIIEEIGTVRSISHQGDGMILEIQANRVLEGTSLGDSISTDGICLTVSKLNSDSFFADVMPETMRRTTFSELRPGTPVNLERAMAADGRFGGHMVSGHIDGQGVIYGHRSDSNAVVLTIKTDPSATRYIIEKGSIAINGISLTVVSVGHDTFQVSLIPTTAKDTTLLDKLVGSAVNLECDMVGKYVEKFVLLGSGKPSVTMDLLIESGFI